MRLTDLHPRWVGAGGEGISNADGSPAPERTGVGLMFDCPCAACTAQRTGDDDKDFHLRVYVNVNPPLDGGPIFHSGGPTWTRIGDTFETLQLSPSILSVEGKGGCGWHGYVGKEIPGEVTTC
jgi:hypothetical protein